MKDWVIILALLFIAASYVCILIILKMVSDFDARLLQIERELAVFNNLTHRFAHILDSEQS